MIVWITGASSGIGAALAETMPFGDARVIDISRSGGVPGAEHFSADLADPSSWEAVGSHLRAELGTFTGSRVVFVHCAGTLEPIGFAGKVYFPAYRRNVLLNCGAPQALGHAFLAASAGRECARHLALISSEAARTPYEGWSSYCAGKAAVEQWVRVVGAEQRRQPHGCQVLAINPGAVATPMLEQIPKLDEQDFPDVEKFRELLAFGCVKAPREVARGIWGLLGHVDSGTIVNLRDWL
jgi:benzil reductase ((S)-benzoin forming)